MVFFIIIFWKRRFALGVLGFNTRKAILEVHSGMLSLLVVELPIERGL